MGWAMPIFAVSAVLVLAWSTTVERTRRRSSRIKGGWARWVRCSARLRGSGGSWRRRSSVDRLQRRVGLLRVADLGQRRGCAVDRARDGAGRGDRGADDAELVTAAEAPRPAAGLHARCGLDALGFLLWGRSRTPRRCPCSRCSKASGSACCSRPASSSSGVCCRRPSTPPGMPCRRWWGSGRADHRRRYRWCHLSAPRRARPLPWASALAAGGRRSLVRAEHARAPRGAARGRGRRGAGDAPGHRTDGMRRAPIRTHAWRPRSRSSVRGRPPDRHRVDGGHLRGRRRLDRAVPA